MDGCGVWLKEHKNQKKLTVSRLLVWGVLGGGPPSFDLRNVFSQHHGHFLGYLLIVDG